MLIPGQEDPLCELTPPRHTLADLSVCGALSRSSLWWLSYPRLGLAKQHVPEIRNSAGQKSCSGAGFKDPAGAMHFPA